MIGGGLITCELHDDPAQPDVQLQISIPLSTLQIPCWSHEFKFSLQSTINYPILI